MRAWVSHQPGLEHLSLDERPLPRPGPGELLLRLRAASISLRDHKMAIGAYGEGRGAVVLGGEGVGEVVELGSAVSGITIGARVSPLFVQGWTGQRVDAATLSASTLGGPLDGTLAEFMVVPAQSCVEVPAHLSDAEAATLPFAGLTAWSAVQGVRDGDTVVVQGTNGVALLALQFAVAAGALVIVSSKNDDKLERARAFGAWQTLNYQREPEWVKRVLEWTAGDGAELVLDPGGAATLAQSLRALRPGGTVSVVGALGASPDLPLSLPWLLGHNLNVRGCNAGPLAAHRAMVAAVVRHQLRPVVDKLLPFADAARAIADAPRGEQFGKVCIAF